MFSGKAYTILIQHETKTLFQALGRADAKDRVVATVDADGNRSAITLDLT